MTSKNDKYNVYNKFDPNFENYGELYKSPREMKQNSKYLINYYADALVKGESPVYKDSPNLVGNRYFINTNSQCLDKNDKTKSHTRSVLIDNVNSTAMETTKDGNTGLIYSLLASLKTINGEEMFNDISNNLPTEYANDSTDYLKDISNVPLPICSKVTVFSNDNKNTEVSGWLTASDRESIDPKAIKEGFVNVNDYMGGDMHPGEWSEQAKKTSAAMDEQGTAVSEEAKKSSDDVLSTADAARNEGPKRAKSQSSSSSSISKNKIKSQSESSKKAFDKAKKKGLKVQLKNETRKYLHDNRKENILFFIKKAINMRYNCSGELEKIADKEVAPPLKPINYPPEIQKKYDKYSELLKMGIAESAIVPKMKNEGLDPRVVLDPILYAEFQKMYDTGVAPSAIRKKMTDKGLDPSKVIPKETLDEEDDDDEKKSNKKARSVRIPSKCIYSIFEENKVSDVPSIDKKRSEVCNRNLPDISVKNVFNSISNEINKNKTNTKELEVPGIPDKNLCYRVKQWSLPFGAGWTDTNLGIGSARTVNKYEDSKDYKKLLQLLERYRYRFALEIVRYSGFDFYGPCDSVEKLEGFTTMDSDEDLTPYGSNQFVNYSAYLFIIAMIFLIFFVVYKCMFRAFKFNSVLKMVKLGKK